MTIAIMGVMPLEGVVILGDGEKLGSRKLG